MAPASCDGADVYRDGQWRCITKVVDFTVTVIDRREVELMTAQAAAQAQSAAQARSITGAITGNNNYLSLIATYFYFVPFTIFYQ